MAKVWTVLDIVNWGTEYFEKHNISSPRLNIELLLCNLLKIDRISIYTNYDKPLKDNELNTLKDWVLRRKESEPIEYLTGKLNYLDLDLNLDPSVLIPRPETELLINTAVELIPEKEEIEVLDIGTGSGCIALQIAKTKPATKVYAVDISKDALKIASENAKKNNINNIAFKKLNILDENIDYKFDLVVSNPPYIPDNEYYNLEKNVLEFEPSSALKGGEDGLIFYRRFAEIFPQIVKKTGYFILEIGYGQKDEIIELFKDKDVNLKFLKDFSGINRVCVGNFLSK